MTTLGAYREVPHASPKNRLLANFRRVEVQKVLRGVVRSPGTPSGDRGRATRNIYDFGKP
jgi:hypothetical protein